MKKLIALMALVSMIAVGCARNKANQGGTSEGNYSTSDTSTSEKGKMQENNNSTATQPSSQSNTSTNSSTQQP